MPLLRCLIVIRSPSLTYSSKILVPKAYPLIVELGIIFVMLKVIYLLSLYSIIEP